MNARQRQQAAGDVAWLIRQSGQTATLIRPQAAGGDSFFGPRETGENDLGSIPIEMKDLAPQDLTEIGADAMASVLPESGVQEQNILVFGGQRYRVTEVKPQNLFGVVTHLDLHLEREKREAAHG